ncbi:biotin--protein ligase-like [Mytilus trossulus]|uniref:biotin--protein ligase-like n=1 Tax=Mytilus trossulus TaxID=6551 RepID=UPI0030077459
MFITAGYLYLYAVHWLRRTRKHTLYRKTITDIFQRGSVLAHKYGTFDTLTDQLLKDVSYIQRVNHIRDSRIILSEITPKVKINLTEWTTYFALEPNQYDKSSEDVWVLVESIRPEDAQEYMKEEEAKNMKTNMLDLGRPIAWKTGPPFGIIMKCSQENFVAMCVAFSDLALSTDEDLIVQKVLSIDVEGHASNLVQKTDEECSMMNNFDEATEVGRCSNESMASSRSVGNMEEVLDGDDNDEIDSIATNEDDLQKMMGESGYGEALSEMIPMPAVFIPPDQSHTSKPPNVLVYAGKKDSARKFQNIKSVFEQCINTDCYILYHLKHDQVASIPWADNCALLVVSCDNLYDRVDAAFLQFIEQGGKVISFGSSLDSDFVPRRELRTHPDISVVDYEKWKKVTLLCGRYCYLPQESVKDLMCIQSLCQDKDGQAMIVDIKPKAEGQGRAILSQVLLDQDPTDIAATVEMFNILKESNSVRLEMLSSLLKRMGYNCDRDQTPIYTPAYLLAKNKDLKSSIMSSIEKRLTEGKLKSTSLTLKFISPGEVVLATKDLLPVVSSDPGKIPFNEALYWKNLSTKRLGNTVFYTDVIHSTMPVLESLQFSCPDNNGLITISSVQTKGQGRGDNLWLSPAGCAMFTIHVCLPLSSHLGKAASFLQHLTSLAVVEGIRTLPGYQDIDLRLKWPNDIYYSDKMKLGGVIVRSTTMNGHLHALIGCGYNVSNKNPTICVNDVINSYNNDKKTKLPELSVEQSIARTVTVMEELIDQFQREGYNSFCKSYYKRWLHSNVKVRLQMEKGKEVTIVGLDEFGYLKTIDENKKTIIVHDDGNSFDMMHNLIKMK